MAFELVDAGAPELAVRLQPIVELDERLGAQAIEPSLAVGAHGDEPGVAEDAQVLRHRRLAQRQSIDEDVHRLLSLAQRIEDAAAAGFSEYFDGRSGGHPDNMPDRLYDCQAI